MKSRLVIGVLTIASSSVIVAHVGPDRADGPRRTITRATGVGGPQPDVTTSRVGLNQNNPGDDFLYHGMFGGIRAFSAASTSCNIGDAEAEWDFLPAGNHPVIAQNLYRLHNGRFEQIGMSWVKHAFCAVSEDTCGDCQPTGCGTLGIGCADTYWSILNGEQLSLGPRTQINPQGYGSGQTHVDPHPLPVGGDAIRGRLQIRDDDIITDGTARYFCEIHYVTHDELAELRNNNASHREVGFNAGHNSLFGLEPGQESVKFMQPAIRAWADANPNVTIVDIDTGIGGRLHLGYAVTKNLNGTWTYEYALHNMNVHSGVAMFGVPLSDAAAVVETGFHDIHYHSGDGVNEVTRSIVDWSATVDGGSVTWATTPFADDENANALLWGTLYNFRVTTDVPPAAGTITIGMWRDPQSSEVVEAMVPAMAEACLGDFDRDDVVGIQDLLALLGAWGETGDPYDLNDDGAVDGGDLQVFVGLWGACP